jgi:HrpA-like RNA helicase
VLTLLGPSLPCCPPPPPPTPTAHLPQLLEDIGALNEQEHLTSLGRHLAALPLPPALGKMLLYGVLFSCLDPILTVACCMAYRWGSKWG